MVLADADQYQTYLVSSGGTFHLASRMVKPLDSDGDVCAPIANGQLVAGFTVPDDTVPVTITRSIVVI